MANNDASCLHTEVKKLFLFAKVFENTRKFKLSIQGSTYILYLLAFVEIRPFNVFFWERKAGFGKLMKNVRDAGFSRKTGGNAGSGPPLPDPVRTSQSQHSRHYQLI